MSKGIFGNQNNPEEEALRNLDGYNTTQSDKGLSDLEQATNQTYIGKVESKDYTKEDVEKTNLKHGFFSVDISEMTSKGDFYPKGTKIMIKSATVKDIRTLSVLDENNPYEVDDALVELLSNCVRVSFPNKVGSWKDLLEEDRLFVILSIRELTFAENENTISFKVKCESCGTENDMKICNANFQKRILSEQIAKYYSPEDRQFNVVSKSFGVVTIKPPTIGVMRIVSNYIKTLKENKQNVKEYLPFLKVLPYLIKEWRTFKIEDINHIRMEFLGWNEKQFLFFNRLVELAQISVKEKMLKECDKCGDPIEALIELPTGIKGLFLTENILDDELM